MLDITKMLIDYNYSSRGSNKIKYIVVHCTGNYNKSAGVDNHYKYFNDGDRGASADYFVDDKKVGMFVEDKNYAWHCGDGRGRFGITNSNSIGVEICVNSGSEYENAVKKAAELVGYLMKKYNISIENVKRHYDASRKQCPKEIMEGKDGVSWDEFKFFAQSGEVSGKLYRVRKSWGDVKSQKGAFTEIENARRCAIKYGFSVYDEKGSCIYKG